MVTRSVVAGCGAYLPERILTNAELAQSVQTSDEWIVQRTGIHQRHIAAEGERTSDLALAAAERALDAAGISGKDIDLIVLATATPDETFPATATRVQQAIGVGRRCALAAVPRRRPGVAARRRKIFRLTPPKLASPHFT